AISLRQVGNLVVSLGEILQTLAQLFFGRPGSQSDKGVRKIPTVVVQLRREVVRLRFALLAYQRGLLIIVVHVVRQRSHVVKKFRIHGPALVFVPQPRADQLPFQLVNSVFEQKLDFLSILFIHDRAQAFVFARERTVFRRRRRRQPTFVNATTLTA